MLVAILLIVVVCLTVGAAWRSQSVGVAAVTAMVASGLSVLIILGVWACAYRNEHWQTCTVINKDRGADDGSYRIYTEQCDTLANEDSIFRGKHNSSNLWTKIEPGKTYEFRIVGYRWGLWSQFANILEVREVSPQPAG